MSGGCCRNICGSTQRSGLEPNNIHPRPQFQSVLAALTPRHIGNTGALARGVHIIRAASVTVCCELWEVASAVARRSRLITGNALGNALGNARGNALGICTGNMHWDMHWEYALGIWCGKDRQLMMHSDSPGRLEKGSRWWLQCAELDGSRKVYWPC